MSSWKFKIGNGAQLRAFRVKISDNSNDIIPSGGFKIQLQNADKRVFSNEENRREKSLLIQKKNIKFGKKKTIKGSKINYEKANLTDYQTSQIVCPQEASFDPDSREISSILYSQNMSVNSVDK